MKSFYFLPDVPGAPLYQAGLLSAPAPLKPAGRNGSLQRVIKHTIPGEKTFKHLIRTFSCSSFLSLYPRTSSCSPYTPGWATFLLHQDERSIKKASAPRTGVCPGRCGGRRRATGGATGIIVAESLKKSGSRGGVYSANNTMVFINHLRDYFALKRQVNLGFKATRLLTFGTETELTPGYAAIGLDC